MDINEILQRDFITYVANLRRLSGSEQQVVIAVLNQLQLEIVEILQSQSNLTSYRESRLRSLLNQINGVISTGYEELQTTITSDMESLARTTVRNIVSAFEGVGIALQTVALSDEQYAALASDALIEGAPSSRWWAKQSDTLKFAFSTEVRKGIVAGESIDDIVRRIRGRSTGKWWNYEWKGKKYRYTQFEGGIINAATRQAQALVRTSVQQVAADTKMAILKENADILKGMQWVATLDSRTTLLCAARDGKLYDLDGAPIGHKLPFLGGPPAHWNCRSTLVPVTKSWKELSGSAAFEEWDKLVSSGTRASMNGYVPATKTFSEWFEDQDEDFQRTYLGPGRYKVWKEGRITIENMVAFDGQPLTLKELSK